MMKIANILDIALLSLAELVQLLHELLFAVVLKHAAQEHPLLAAERGDESKLKKIKIKIK